MIRALGIAYRVFDIYVLFITVQRRLIKKTEDKAEEKNKMIKIKRIIISLISVCVRSGCNGFLITVFLLKHCLVLCSPNDHTYHSFIFTPIGLA